jgi:hypothetical protein
VGSNPTPAIFYMPYKDPAKQREFQRLWKRKTKDWFQKLKKTLKCIRCGFGHPAALQFHHKGGKVKNVSRMVQQNLPREVILAEILKCDVLCANCHAIEHYEP